MAHLVRTLIAVLLVVGAAPSRGVAAEPGPDGLKFVTAPLKNLNAVEAARTLREAFGVATSQPTSERGVITADRDTNTLVISGPESFCQAVREMAAELDKASKGNVSVAVDVTLYQIQLPTEKLATLSIADLQSAATDPAGFYKYLATLGECNVNGRMHQRVNLVRGSELSSGASIPFLTGSQKTNSGQINRTIEYRDVGNKVRISGTPSAASGGGDVSMKIESSALPKSDIEFGDSIAAPAFQKFVQVYEGPYESGRPIVTISSNSVNSSATKAMLGVARVVLTAGETGK